MQTPSLLETIFLVMLFCLTGGILTSGLLGLSLQADYWILCTTTLLVTCEVFMLGEGLRSGRRRLELFLLALSSAAVPFVLGFVTQLSTNDEPLHITADTVAILFVLSLLWPAYMIFYMARRLRFKESHTEANSVTELDHIKNLVTTLATDPLLPRTQVQQLQYLARRLSTGGRLASGPRQRLIASVIGTISQMRGIYERLEDDHVVRAYARQKNLGIVDQLIAASAFISIVVTVGNWSLIPFAVSVSRFRVLTLVVDLRLLVIAVLVVFLASEAVLYVAKTPRPIPPQLRSLRIGPELHSVDKDSLIGGMVTAFINALNAFFAMLTALLNGFIYIMYTLLKWLMRVFKQMARLIIESLTKAGTWRLTLYTCITFFGFLLLGVFLGRTAEAIIQIIKSESGISAIGPDLLVRYLIPVAFFVIATMVLVANSYLFNLLFDRDKHWASAHLNQLLLGFVPIAVSVPISGFVLWVIAKVFPATALNGFNSMGIVTWVGVLLVLAYAFVIFYNNQKAIRRRSS